ncbi:DUF498-domain-containing protein [Vararia minispora EC-137]|uniref:DUF498-domain-containing protein n=1 Tax=Vararia minispora EC-137 TaxID=1314806 RepID=A0ACB8QYA0_9AGAM|nr:DUF498-domain-containing protein [Vararia minispora EC-137]
MLASVVHGLRRPLAPRATRVPVLRKLYTSPVWRADERWQQLTNILADDNPPPVQVKSMSDAGIELADGQLIPGACIFIDGKIFLWDVPPTQWRGWSEERFEMFEIIVPRPEILLLGTGKAATLPPASLRQYLSRLGIQLDVMDSWSACTTYNLLAEEGRRVAAALLPFRPRPWKKQPTIEESTPCGKTS